MKINFSSPRLRLEPLGGTDAGTVHTTYLAPHATSGGTPHRPGTGGAGPPRAGAAPPFFPFGTIKNAPPVVPPPPARGGPPTPPLPRRAPPPPPPPGGPPRARPP